ncbi:hypothetical protein MACJ_003088 [Theileria orientalis]|uniref:Uncharacterized protein n=1 Tax=Theileria orientalis TaxID=68886 RepID=A0A976QRW2_THEOR|nr:hypothetical protein MACJ_003088 [Theileria orientalis]
MSTNTEFSYRPSKIIITVTPSTVLIYPFTVLSHKLNVLTFQRSLCDPYSTSDGSLRELSGRTVGTLSFGVGLYYGKKMAVSIYKRHGILGFFRCLPEYLGYQITKDVMKYVVPNFVLPLFGDLRLRLKYNLPTNNVMDLAYNFRSRYMRFLDNDESLFAYFVHFYKNMVQSDYNKILVSGIVEFLTYPLLSIISKLIIYDGFMPVSFFSMVQHTVVADGFFALYNGFFYHLLSNSMSYVHKNFGKFVYSCAERGFEVDRAFEQTLNIIFTFATSVVNQFSLILRCGSNLDGLCMNVGTLAILKTVPWTGILFQLSLLVALVEFKERFMARQIKAIRTRLDS